jgi:hypothetical protein
MFGGRAASTAKKRKTKVNRKNPRRKGRLGRREKEVK